MRFGMVMGVAVLAVCLASGCEEAKDAAGQAATDAAEKLASLTDSMDAMKAEAAKKLDVVKAEAAEKLAAVQAEATEKIEAVKAESVRKIAAVQADAASRIESAKAEASAAAEEKLTALRAEYAKLAAELAAMKAGTDGAPNLREWVP